MSLSIWTSNEYSGLLKIVPVAEMKPLCHLPQKKNEVENYT